MTIQDGLVSIVLDDLQALPDDSIAVQSFKQTVKAEKLKRWNVEENSSLLLLYLQL